MDVMPMPHEKSLPAVATSRARWWGLVAISLAVSLIIVDSTIVNVAVPYIVRDLDITSTQVQWVQESYTLVFAATLLVFGAIADRVGRRRLMLLGVVIFALSSVVAAIAPTGDLLILSRVAQGFGGAMILPTTLSLINATFRGRERGIAFAVWGSTIGGMAAVGPLLGGWLTTSFSWRWAFGINVPLGAIIILGVLLFVAESKAPTAGRLDIGGAALSAITFAALAFGLIEGREYGWWLTDTPFAIGDWTWPLELSPIPFAFAISLLAGAAFVVRGRRRLRAGRPNLIDFDLFRIASFRNGNIAAMIVSLGEFGIILSLPLWLQNVLGYTALQTGVVLLALAGGSFLASGLAATLGQRFAPATVVRVGIAAEIVGVGGIALTLHPDATWLTVAPFLFVYGLGIGLATAQLTGVVLADVPVQQSGSGSGTQSTARQVGSALGIAILGTILFSVTAGQLQSSLDDAGVPAAQSSQVVDGVVDSAGGAISGLDQDPATAAAATAAREAFTDGTRASAGAAALFLGIGLLATISLGRGVAPGAEPRDRSRGSRSPDTTPSAP
ncbi:MAG: DHA2 family efflux MFS transporter permease subunit [Microbacteriaceae bacterium]